MKLYMLNSSHPQTHAQLLAPTKTWTNVHECPECRRNTSKLLPPLELVWEVGIDVIGDFSWWGYLFVVTPLMVDIFKSLEVDLQYYPTHIAEAPRKKGARRRPYAGPPLTWVVPNRRIPFEEDSTGLHMSDQCHTCGHRNYKFRRNGLIFSKNDLHGTQMFKVDQFERANAVLVTRDFANLLRDISPTNVEFWEAGESV